MAALLLDWFPSQRSKRWFTEDLFLALMRLRGMEAGSPTGYAEAFHGRKVVLGRLAILPLGIRDAAQEEEQMAELTQIETKIAEVIGLAQAARGRPRRCRSSSRTAG